MVIGRLTVLSNQTLMSTSRAFGRKKLFAWRCYEGEERPFPFPRSDKGLEVLANYRGMQSGIRLAEAFKLLRHTAVES